MQNQGQEHLEGSPDLDNTINNMSCINADANDNDQLENLPSNEPSKNQMPKNNFLTKQQSGEQPYKAALTLSKALATGSASRISAYRNGNSQTRSQKNSFMDKPVSEYRNYNTTRSKIIRSVSGTGLSDGDDENQNEQNYFKDDNKDVDIGLAVKNLQESEQVVEIIEKIEENHFQAKKKVNQSDLVSLDSDVTAQTLNTCYSIVSSELVDEIINFDREKMDHRLDAALIKVRQDNSQWNKLKGEFIGLSDPVVNKDILAFRLERVKKNMQRQETILQKLPPIQKILQENKTNLVQLKQSYEIFENEVFKLKLLELDKIKTDTESLITKINSQVNSLQSTIQTAQQNIQEILPLNNEQRQKILSLQIEISNLSQRLELSANDHRQRILALPELKKKYEDLKEEMKNTEVKQLVDMVQKSRKIKKVVNCLKFWQDLFQKLSQINNQKLNQIQFDLAKVEADSQRFQDQVSSDKNEEFQDIQKQIQKLAKKVKSERDDQENRLDKFENQFLKTNSLNVQNEHINDQDLLFLKKEVSRDRAALAAINSLVNQILEDSLKIREDSNKEPSSENKLPRIQDEDLQYLKANLKVLQRQDQVDIPRIINNIDQLNAFSSKTLKNSLNDDNKKSQSQISKMKKNYEDFQKLIDILNAKLQKRSKEVVALKENFQNEDLDRELTFKTKLDDILETCAEEINSLEPMEDKKSLQQQKKDIISDINSMVTLFNENNKLIKQTNKEQKTDFEINDLVQCNKDIQNQCEDLETKIIEAKAFADLIDKKLDSELGDNIKNIQDKFQNKNKLIDECDEQFDIMNQQIEDKQLKLQLEINKLDTLIKKLEDLSPLNQPTPKGTDNTQLFQTIGKYLEEARNLRNDLEDQKDKIQELKEAMIQAVQPLNELADRTVTFDDVLKVKNNLLSIEGKLDKLNKEIDPKLDQVSQILKGVEATIDQDKSSRLKSADHMVKELEKILDELILERQECKKKLQQLKEIIEQSKNDPNLQNNPELQDKIEQAKKELAEYQNKLDNLDQKIDDISKKTQESKQLLEQAKKDQNSITPQKLTALIAQINDQKDNGKTILSNIQQLDDQISNSIKRLTDSIGQTQLQGQLLSEAHEISEQVADDLDALEKVIDSLPNQIEKMLGTNVQMQKDSTDNSGDYWEERVRIAGHIEALQNIKPNIDVIKKELAKRKQRFEQLQIQVNKESDVDNLKQMIKSLKESQNLVVENVNQAVAITETAEQIKQEMGDCEIPVNSKVRKNELLKYSDKLQSIVSEFQEIESSQSNHHPENESEKQIQVLIKEISEKLKPIRQEESEMKQYQKDHFEALKESEIFSYDNAIIIKDIFGFKQKIMAAFLKLKDLEKVFNDLNTKMIQNDIENASVLLGKRSNKLKARLEQASDTLKKIKKAGEDMDGNASQSEEEELIDALKNEMPEVFKNIDLNDKEIDKINLSIQQVAVSKDPEVMGQIKKQLGELEKKVEESEGLALKLENEIIEWNAIKKLIRRDEELHEVENICFDLRDEVVHEANFMNEELEKNASKTQNESAAKITKEIVVYIQDLESVKTKINKLNQKRDNLFGQFDIELPLTVVLARDKRLQQQNSLHSPRVNSSKGISSNQRNPNAVLWDKDIYYMIFVNCKYRTPIHELLKELRIINQERRDLDQKYAKLKQDLNSKNKAAPYKPVKGDPIDELFAKSLNAAGINLPVKRLGPGKYMFGSRQIMAKIINGKLVIRVGGGYMSADEFIDQYGKIEMAKMMKAAGNDGNHDDHVGHIDGPATSMGDMKAIMRQSLLNVKVYQDEHSARQSTTGKGFGEKQGEVIKQGERMSLAQLEKEYEPVKFGATQPIKPSKRIDITSPKRETISKGLVTPKAQAKK